ncbi:prepilin-type N-terminal cleavage/methylation domain-containing protein [Clostridium isatidis]|uniref:prepilin-type N-terminal cleavage/methylation domain-containing protein n=1 Tax=Clostridium isatidis TaxID=182773 RepID=UPI001A9A547A|nr:prepilin-type N-terminal cleavage/methylation domain-containing protein [Clostridium isatidis]
MRGNSLKQIGYKKKKKGYTLIELIIAIALELIVLGVSYQIISITYKSYKFYNEKSIRKDSFDDALITIDRLIKGKMIENINIIDNDRGLTNEIIITYREKHSEDKVYQKKIKLDNFDNKIVLETYKNNFRTGINVIMREVSDFTIIKKGKLFYLIIENIYGEERIQCL